MSLAASRFRAMNTEVVVLTPVPGPQAEEAFRVVRQIFLEVERCLSRFRPDSELSALNGSAGKPFTASPLLYHAVSLAIDAALDSDGMFDPTIIAALESTGYDRSFERIAHSRHVSSHNGPAAQRPDYRCVRCNPRDRTIELRAGRRIDLGGIGKGLAVDRALAATEFLADRCIAAGGDVAARGTSDTETGWIVALEDTGDVGQLSVDLRDAALATSSVTKRRWEVNGQKRHHLIDPRTASASPSFLRSVTAVASSCAQADVAAKVALLLDDQGMAFLDRRGIHGFGVRHDGSTVQTTCWPDSSAAV